MAEVTTIARPYAEAVFDLARAGGLLEQWSKALARLATVAVHPDVAPVLGDPRLTDSQVVELILAAAGDVGVDCRNFVATLAHHGRLAALPQVHILFDALKDDSEGVIQAEVRSAFALSAEDLQSLVAGLERRFRRKVDARVEIDPSLIGGVRIGVGDEVIDSSVRGKLAAMRSALVA